MSNPHDPQQPNRPHQPGQHPDPTQPSGQQFGGHPSSPQQWAPQYANSGSLTSNSFPPAGSGSGYQPGYPSEHPQQQGYVNGPYGQKPPKQKKPLLKRWWFWLLAIIVVIAIASAIGGGGADTTDETDTSSSQEDKASGAEDDKAAEEADTFGIGDAVSADGWEITVGDVKDGVSSVGDEYLGAEAQGQFVTVDLSVKNTESEPDYFFEDNIKLGDDKGNSYSADVEAGFYLDEDSLLFLEEINPGNTAKGVLVFDVPEDVSPDRLTFAGGIFSDQIEVSLK